MTLTATDLVLCAGTLLPSVGFRERVEVAAAAGFQGLSIWGRDYERAHADGLSDADIVALLDDHGIGIGEIDGIWSWLPGAPSSVPADQDEYRYFRFSETDLFHIGEAVGARSVNAIDFFGGWELDGAVESFAALCDRAAEHGLLINLEFLPWCQLGTLAQAWAIVSGAGRPNGGIMLDAWHFTRAGADFATLDTIPGEWINGIQLNDGPAEAEPDLMEACLHERLLPGDGAFPLDRLLASLRARGVRAPIGLEVFNDGLFELPAADAAKRGGDALRAVLQ